VTGIARLPVVRLDEGGPLLRAKYDRPCSGCGVKQQVGINALSPWYKWVCESCGLENEDSHAYYPSDVLLRKASFEFDDGDYDSAIVLSALAVEANLARLYSITKTPGQVNEYGYPKDEAHERAIAESWSQIGGIKNRLNAVSKACTGQTFNGFVTRSPRRIAIIKSQYPFVRADDVVSSIQSLVFKPRNSIVHWGRTEYAREDAKHALSAALLCTEVLLVALEAELA
jgi:hypothetical protein